MRVKHRGILNQHQLCVSDIETQLKGAVFFYGGAALGENAGGFHQGGDCLLAERGGGFSAVFTCV